jgi:hypothetical protein
MIFSCVDLNMIIQFEDRSSDDLRHVDQPHHTRALKRWLGMTPGEIIRRERQLSFLYKTDRS